MTPRDLGESYLRKAKQDQVILTKNAGDFDIADESLGFHAQQAVEKALKAVLVVKEIRPPRTHDLVYLIDVTTDAGVPVPAWLSECESLNDYAVEFRYTEALLGAPLDRAAIVELVGRVVA